MESFRTVLYTFKLNTNTTDTDSAVQAVQSVLVKYFPSLTQTQRISLGTKNNDFLVVFNADIVAITFTLRYYHSEQLFTLNGECSRQCREFAQMNNSTLELLQTDLEKAISMPAGGVSVERLPVLKRNSPVPIYFPTSDQRVIEYDFDKLVYHHRSEFQDIKILHSPSLGNTLLLDGSQNLAEADLNYTRGLMNYGVNSFKDKEVLILGSGDGGLLNELLKEEPKFVTMVEIDEAVMNACKEHLRGACGSVFDSFQGPKYKIIVGDCLVYMKQFIEQKRTFDYVIYDLTEIPIGTSDSEEPLSGSSPEVWQFVEQVLHLAMPLVRSDGGKYLCHTIGATCTNALQMFEQMLDKFPIKLEYSRRVEFVPSSLEEWVFYQIIKV